MFKKTKQLVEKQNKTYDNLLASSIIPSMALRADGVIYDMTKYRQTVL